MKLNKDYEGYQFLSDAEIAEQVKLHEDVFAATLFAGPVKIDLRSLGMEASCVGVVLHCINQAVEFVEEAYRDHEAEAKR